MSDIFPYIDTWLEAYDENPVGSLNQLVGVRKWRLTFTPCREIGPVHCRLFAMAVVVNGWRFREIKDRQKKHAKKHACHLALRVIFMRSKCILQDKIPEQEVDLAMTLSLSPEDLTVIPNYVEGQEITAVSDGNDFSADVNVNQASFDRSGPNVVPMNVDNAGEPVRKKVKYEVSKCEGRNAVSILVQYGQNQGEKVTFDFANTATPPPATTRPQHTCKLQYGDKSFPMVTAHTKKAAKHNAAVMAVTIMSGEGHAIVLDVDSLKPIEVPPAPEPVKRKQPRAKIAPSGVMPDENHDDESLKGPVSQPFNRNPVTILSEYAQSRAETLTFTTVSQSGMPHNARFVLAAKVGERSFDSVECGNKRVGRLKASEIAIKEILKEGGTIPSMTTGYVEIEISETMNSHDKIAALSHKCVNTILTEVAPVAGRKVISTIVMKQATDDIGSVICLGMGNKVIGGDSMSMSGEVLNDSHAEVIARRSFIRFLYGHLLQFTKASDSKLFQKSTSGKLRIKDGITFHMYISTAPCGDGALFSLKSATPEEQYAREVATPIYLNANHGLLRTKLEGGEGTIPVDSTQQVQTWDGIVRGERLRTMSCSDKICRWNVLGLQGALLSHFLDPIYLSSLTLGNMYHAGHLSRAISMRLNRELSDPIQQHLPPTYYHTMPEIGKTTVCRPPREAYKSKHYSVNWIVGDESAEVTNSTTGRCMSTDENETGDKSRLSKAIFFSDFRKVCEKFRRHNLKAVESYSMAKLACKDYMTAKTTLKQRFKSNNYGRWVEKPVEEEMFNHELPEVQIKTESVGLF